MKKTIDFIYKKETGFVTQALMGDLVIVILLYALVIGAVYLIYTKNFSQSAVDERVRDIYQQLIVNTGQSQEALPLVIVESPEINAYNDGNNIVIYRGLIDSTESWDEVALVLGHEIAHGMLWHLRMLNQWKSFNDQEVSVMEANADKLGVVYMMKAGYDVCKGREMFKHWKELRGNALAQSHPDFSYRYDELNINCN